MAAPPGPLVDLPEVLAGTPLANERAPRVARWAAIALGVLAVTALLGTGGAQPADPYLSTSRVPGFDEGTLRVLAASPATGLTPAEYCVLLATTQDQQTRGLKGRTDLAGYPAMAFRWPGEVSFIFVSRGVGLDFSVAWFDAEGRYLDARDLDACPDVNGCPTAAAPGPYRYAVETEKGRLGALGIGPGARVDVADGCR